MTKIHLSLPANTVVHPAEDEHLPAQNIEKRNEESYRSDYSLQESKPADAEYTSFRSEEHCTAPVSKDKLTKHLSYAERRLRNHL